MLCVAAGSQHFGQKKARSPNRKTGLFLSQPKAMTVKRTIGTAVPIPTPRPRMAPENDIGASLIIALSYTKRGRLPISRKECGKVAGKGSGKSDNPIGELVATVVPSNMYYVAGYLLMEEARSSCLRETREICVKAWNPALVLLGKARGKGVWSSAVFPCTASWCRSAHGGASGSCTP